MVHNFTFAASSVLPSFVNLLGICVILYVIDSSSNRAVADIGTIRIFKRTNRTATGFTNYLSKMGFINTSGR